MTPHQVLALGIRLFVIWSALAILREAAALAIARDLLGDRFMLGFIVGAYLLTAVVLLILWFFPKSIARGLLPNSTEPPTQALSYQMWFTLGTALIGIWFAASAITPILRNLTVLFILRPDLVDMANTRAATLFYVAQLVLGLGLLFGASGIRRFVWWARNAGHE